MNIMQEEKFKLDSFIGGWYINSKICDDLIKFFEKSSHRQTPGVLYIGSEIKVKEDYKKSIDITLQGNDTVFDAYNKELQKCLVKYMKLYPEVNDLYGKFTPSIEGYNIQKYNPGDGYYKFHCERHSYNSRCLVFMTYLNTVKDGGTIFKYQKITTQAKKGLTLIWPTDFTHTHKGQVSNETKYIVTGWYNYF